MKKGEELGSKGIAIDWDELINNNDDPPAELVVTSAIKHQQFTMDGEEGISHLSITELIDKIARLKKSLSSNIGARLPDGGQKLKANIKLHEDELERRKRVGSQKEVDGCVRHDFCSIGAPDNFEPQASPSVSSSQATFAACFLNKLEAKAESKPANAFQEELYALNPCDRKSTLNNQFSKRKRHKRESLSQEAHYKFPVDNGEQVLNVDLKGRDSSSRCSEESITICFSEKTKASQARSSYTRRHANGEAVVLVDEGEPDAIKETEQVDQVVERKVTKIYYPSRVDPESVEICCSDMESLAPEAYLSSTIMNFYIRYLQKTKLHADVDAYHFFNTYFYQKLKEAVLTKQNEKEASFVRLRRWWKGVNIFEKAYIFLPIHEDLHWSLVIICIPDKEDQLGPILLHLDSLGLHSSESLFATIRKFLVQEWKFLRQGEVPALPISDKIWENLPRRINENIIPVPQQRNEYDCGLFVLFFMERFIEQVHGRLKKKDFAMFGRRWFKPEEASCLRMKIRCILKIEFKNASED
ncbi:ubiquitin-like-specific protease 1D isoform X2 [Lycium ferocissimum]|uniref:ubiquitin-like-specific protease 1D isoform X2 n=1 Tax=Lycium ferocissimum TaxID=112874 RepID=UPI002816904A|nr:ubiquitin-like-specific protease 1D isoform X2 [Lycium ferocissimum]